MSCYSYINWYENLIRKLHNNVMTALSSYDKEQDPLSIATPCPSNTAIYIPSAFKCPVCPMKITQIMDKNLMTFDQMCYRNSIEPCPYLRFINSFLENNFREESALERIPISKGTFDEWFLLCLEVCNRWMETQKPIAGTNLDVDIENALIPLRGERIGTSAKFVFKATVRNRTNYEGIVIVTIPDLGYDTLISRIRKYVPIGNNLYFDKKATYDVIKNIDAAMCRDYQLKHTESVSTILANQIQSKNIQFWKDLNSFVSSPGLKMKTLQENFARYLFLSRYKVSVLYSFLQALANYQQS